jgi:DNA mismatch repair protein MutS2
VREKDFSHLELWKVFERLKGYFNSKATEKFLQTLKPYTDVEGLRQEIQLVEDFLAVEESLTLYPFGDIEPYVKKSVLQDATLSLEEILEIYKVIKLIRDARKALGAHVPLRKSLGNLLKTLHHFPQIEGIIESTIDQRGFVKDSASQELATIRKKIRDLEKEVTKRLENILNRPDADRLLSKIFLKSVRHPLLVFTRDHVVPIDIKIEGKRGLVLTGPNTGGKTVALKTLGLCAFMFQFALPIPIEEGELPVFEGIYTDIGDEQSIEQNLSTFSAHVSNLAEFLPLVNEKSLALLDELGAGTDPMEGSVLSIGVLEYLKDKNAYVFATTHHTPVKLYALESDYYTPASVSFDKETLEPTYYILYDAVGSSMAFEIAKRFGMPEEVLEYARKKMPAEFERFSKAKEDLEELIKEYQKKLREVEQAKEELERMKAEYSSLLAISEEVKERAYREGVSRALQYLQEIEREAEELLKSARERQKIKQFVGGKKQEVMKELKEEAVKVGDWVEFMGSRGRVLEIKEDKVQVSFGSVKAWVERQKLKKAHPPIEQEEYSLEVKKKLPTEINLIGLSTEEALYKLESFLKEAKALGVKSVKVIHGTGVLKRVVENFLEGSELVVFRREGYPREGGAGVSVVFLEKP